MKDQQKIIFLAFFSNGYDNSSGRQGGETAYDPNVSLENYTQRFENETKKIHRAGSVSIGYIRVTEHNEDGSFKRDSGRRVEKYLVKNRVF